MKTSKLFITSLLAAAAMSVPAFGDITYTDADGVRTFTGATSQYYKINNSIPDSITKLVFDSITTTGNGAWFAGGNVSQAIDLQGTGIEIKGGSTTTVTFSGALTGVAGSSFTWKDDSDGTNAAGNKQKFIFSGDLTGFAGSFNRVTNGSTATTGGIQFGADTATTYSSSATATDGVISNISGTGSIATSAGVIYNYTGGANGETLSVNNSSITAKTLTFGGGANYTVASTVTGQNSTASNNTLTISAGTTTFTGAVSNFGTINVASGAKAIFQGAFTNVVGSTKNNLTIAAGSDVSFQSTVAGGVLTANADSTVKFSSTASFTQLSGSGTIDLGSTGTLTLSPPSGSSKFNNWMGTVAFKDRTITHTAFSMANYGTTGSTIEFSGVSGVFKEFAETVNANLHLVNSTTNDKNYGYKVTNGTSTGAVTFAGKITGTGDIVMAWGTGTAFTFTGNVSEFEGKFSNTGKTSGANTNVVLTFSGTPRLSEGQSSVSGKGNIEWGNNCSVVYNYGAADVQADNKIVSAILKKQGTGSLKLTGTNTYTGGTTVEAGTLVAGSVSAFGSGALTVNAGAKVSANGYAVDLGAGNVTINGTYVVTADGSLGTSGTITFGDAGTLDVSGLAAGTYTVFGGTGTVSGLTQNKLYKEFGRDTVTFADDTYKTFTLTKGAVYDLTWTSAAGTWAADTTWQNNTQGGEENPTFADGDTVTFAASETAAKEISVVGAKDAQAVNVAGGDYAFSAGEGGSLSVRGALTVSSGASLTVNEGVLGAVSGGISLEANSTLKLVGAAIDGMTNIVSGSGKVVLDKGSVISTEPTISVANVLRGAISVEKIGNTKVSITAAQSYTGGTKITAGNIGVGHNEALGSGTITLNGSNAQMTSHAAGLNFDNAVTIGENGGIVHTQAYTMTLSGAVSGTGTLTKQGAGTLVLSNAGTSVDVAFAEGNLQVARATINIVSTTSAGNIDFNGTGGTVVFKGTTESAGTIYSVGEIKTTSSDNYARNVTIESGATVNATSFTNSWGMGTLRVDGELNVSGSLSFATGPNGNQTTNVITGDGTIKVGTLNIGNVGTYTIDVNRLEIGSGGITISNNRGTGKTTYLGKTTIVASESWSSVVSSNQKFTLNSSEGTTFEMQKSDGTATNAAFASIFEGTGKLIKTGAGTLTLSGNNTFTGGVTIERGVLVAGHANALGTTAGTTTVNSGGVLKVAVDGGVTAGTVTLNEGALFAIDLTEYSNVEEDTALTIISSSAISFNSISAGAMSSNDIEAYFSASNSNLGSWSSYLREWSYDTTNGLRLTLTIPEPSMFGLLAGLGALALAGTRRRRKA